MFQEHSKTLLEGERTESVKDAKRTVTWRQGDEEIQVVQDIHESQGPRQGFPPRQAKSARLLSARGEVLSDVDATCETVARSFAVSEWKSVTQPNSRPLTWQAWDEPNPAERHDKGIVSVDPVEQLSLTKDSTDYCWYSTTLQVVEAGPQEMVILYGADFFYLYVDGHQVTTSALPI